jgi:hypothetical protein
LQEIEQQARDASKVEELVELMEEWREGCQWCRACRKEGRGHELEDCKDEDAGQAQTGYAKFKEH